MASVSHHSGKRAASACFAAALVVAAVVATLVAPAATATTSRSTSRAAGVLGSVQKATGTSVKVGFVSDGKSDTIDNTPEIKAAQAATQYVNQYQGGVAGHPIDLDVCETHQTPAGATDCATQMVNDKVVAVLYGVTGQGGSLYKGLQGSNIPLVALGSIDQDTLTGPGAFALANLLSSVIAAPAGVARSKGVKHAAVVVIDVPAASGPVKAIGPTFYKNAGVDVDVVTIPPGTADMTPQIQAELAKNPGQFAVIGDSTFCTSALKAIKTVGFKGSIVINPECIGENTGASIPGGYSGVAVTTWNTSSDHSTKDYKVYSAVLDKYAKGSSKGGTAPGGYMAIRSFADAMDKATGAIDAGSVMSTFSAMASPVAFPMVGGTTFQCGTKPVAIAPNICASAVLQGKLDKQGAGSNFKVLETADLTKIG
jgi:branched-chain amino acid transport system substrate-binding protein